MVRHAGQGLGHRLADGVLAVGDDADDRHRQAVADLADQLRQLLLATGQQALGQQHLAAEAVAQHPQDLMADVGLQAIDGQDDAALLGEQAAESAVVGQRDGEQFVVAVQEVGDGAFGDVQAAAAQGLVDLGDAAVFGVAEAADEGDDVEAELVLGQGVEALGFGAVGLAVAAAVGVVAAADVQEQADQSSEGGDGASVAVVGPEGPSAGRANGSSKGGGVRCVSVGDGVPSWPERSPDRGAANPNPQPGSPSSQLCCPRFFSRPCSSLSSPRTSFLRWSLASSCWILWSWTSSTALALRPLSRAVWPFSKDSFRQR